MPIAELMSYQNTKNGRYRIAMMLAQHCAPLFMGDKISNIITLDKSDFREVKDILLETDISYRILKSARDKLILFLYRKFTFEKYLGQKDIRVFLRSLGYDPGASVERLLDRLAHRVYFFQNGQIGFPHEIGVFLGYPLHDCPCSGPGTGYH